MSEVECRMKWICEKRFFVTLWRRGRGENGGGAKLMKKVNWIREKRVLWQENGVEWRKMVAGGKVYIYSD